MITESFTLRPYQEKAVARGVEFMATATKGHGLEVLPTGSGKSLVIANIASRLQEPTLIFQPSKEIMEQNEAKLRSYGYRPAIFSASMNRKRIGDITLATIGSVNNKAELFRDFRYVIVDEAHLLNPKRGMYSGFLGALRQDIRILGLTATPFRLSTDRYGGAKLKFLTRTRPRILTDVVDYVQTGDLFREGHLCPLEYHRVKGFNPDKLLPNSAGSDYSDGSVQRHMSEIHFENILIRAVDRLLEIGRKSVLVFTRFVQEAEYVASRIEGAAVVTGETPKRKREQIVADFRSGAVKVVCNVGVLSVGFDFPELEAVVLARPTMSLGVYYQQVGRAVRPAQGKTCAMIVDMVGLLDMFGRVEDLILRRIEGKWVIVSGRRQLTNRYFCGNGEAWKR